MALLILVLSYLSRISNTITLYLQIQFEYRWEIHNFIKIYSWHFLKTFHLSLLVQINCLLRTCSKDFLVHEINLKILRVQYTPNMIWWVTRRHVYLCTISFSHGWANLSLKESVHSNCKTILMFKYWKLNFITLTIKIIYCYIFGLKYNIAFLRQPKPFPYKYLLIISQQ